MNDIRTVTTLYYDGWKQKDAGLIRACLHPEVHFLGPLTRFEGTDDVMGSFQPV
jgi:hypothetical protein